MPENQNPNEVFADLVNCIHEMMNWDDDKLSAISIDLNGKRCGFSASMRWLTSRMHERCIEVHNHINNFGRK